jgi:uncharacterized protein (UPF0248 family)
MPRPRDILNELKWREDRDLVKAEIWYVHRGAQNDTKIITGADIMELDRPYMVLRDAEIPYHRIFKIVYNGEVIFRKKRKI